MMLLILSYLSSPRFLDLIRKTYASNDKVGMGLDREVAFIRFQFAKQFNVSIDAMSPKGSNPGQQPLVPNTQIRRQKYRSSREQHHEEKPPRYLARIAAQDIVS